MAAPGSDIVIFGESDTPPSGLTAALQGLCSYRVEPLSTDAAGANLDCKLAIYCANPASPTSYEKLKQSTSAFRGDSLFVLPTHNSKAIDRVRSLGISDFFVQPLDFEDFQQKVRSLINKRVEGSWNSLDEPSRVALQASLTCFEDIFGSISKGEPLPLANVDETCSLIAQSVASGSLSTWIDALDDHHNYTFRHSMFVCGILTYFAHAIGIKGDDLHLLAVGSLLHDVGKSQIPLNILDKPGKLDGDEWDVMKTHPEHSRTILLREHGLDPTIVAMAVHHHEKIDGTGYPDGLAAGQISDTVRLTAIADVYSALIDKRSYKEGMSKEKALKIMSSFEGHLDQDFVRSFRGFVLDSEKA